MGNNIILETKFVADISGSFYIPSYQRGYRWSATEVVRLLDDIYQNGKKNYCLQPVVVRKKGEQYELIDGQQRLTTLYLIYKYMKNVNPFFNEPAFTLSYQTRDQSEEFLKTLDMTKQDVITSQSYDTLCKVKELAPEIQTGYILALGVGSYYDLPAADFFSVESTFITPGMVQQIHLRGKTISAWTVNRQEDASDLLSLGVDDIITDKPEMVQQLMNADADLDNDLLFIRDTIRSLIGWFDAGDEPTPEEEVIEEAIEDPEELLDAA